MFYYYWSVNINEYNVLILRLGHHSVFFPRSNNSVIKKRSVAFVAFWLISSEGDRKGNCHPGLVVKNDLEVTGPMKDDFYLLSHAATQGSTLSIICLADLLMDFILFSFLFCALYSLAQRHFHWEYAKVTTNASSFQLLCIDVFQSSRTCFHTIPHLFKNYSFHLDPHPCLLWV